MRFVNSWTSEGKHHLLHFDQKVLDVFIKHQQRFLWQKEAGGILLGSHRGSNLEVVDATEPFPTDRRSRCSFVRDSIGHADAAINQWTASQGTITYIGEWHTHPERNPSPSLLDMREWGLLAEKQSSSSLIISAIVGTESFYCAIISPKKLVQLLPLDSNDATISPV